MVEVFSNEKFHVLISNLFEKEIHLQKERLVARERADFSALNIIDSSIKQCDTVNAITMHETKLDKDQQLYKHLEVTNKDANQLLNNWKGET